MRNLTSGGGWPAIWYSFKKARQAGGFLKLWKAMRSKNACKTCALGMGGQSGGMVNELGHFPEVCKKSLQAMVADMQGAIRSDFFNTYSVPQLQSFSPRELENCGRLTQPLLLTRGEQYYRAISWEDAFRRIAAKLKAVAPAETFWYFSGRSSNEAGFLLQLFARLYGTNNVNNCSFYCHQASGVGLASSIGSGTATLALEDLEHADLAFVIGGNPASNHPRLMTTLAALRRRGGNVIAINPVIEMGLVNFRVPSRPRSLLFGSQIASLYVQPDIGGDLALLTGVAKRIVEMGAIEREFLENHCEGWPELAARLQSVSWEEICEKSGVTRADIDKIAAMYAAAKNVVFSWTMGITHHAHGVKNVEAIANLALLRGMVGRPNAGLMPIRGHSNVQGIGSVGVTPKLKDAVFERLQNHFGVKLPTDTGLDTLGCIEAANAGRLKFGFCLGGNLYGSNPDATFAAAALAKLDQLVYLNTTLNTGHAHGLAAETIILPVLARDEEPQSTTQESMFNYVRLSDGGPARHAGPKSEVDVIASIAHDVLGSPTSGSPTMGSDASSNGAPQSDPSRNGAPGAKSPVDWQAMQSTERIREAIAKIVPGFEALATIGTTKQEFQVGGRTLRTPQFPTPSGRARLRIHALPDMPGADDELRLMTVRSEGQFNTVVYEDEDLYRGQDRRDIILLNPADCLRLGLVAEQRVSIISETGRMDGILVRPFERIKSGNALMYYPEANVLVSRLVDPQSRTPAFKSILVRVHVPARVAAPIGV